MLISNGDVPLACSLGVGFCILDFGPWALSFGLRVLSLGFLIVRFWVFGFGGGWGLLIFEALGLGLRVWGFGFVYSMLRLGLGVLDFWVFGFCVLGCRIWELRFGLESWGVCILLVFGLSFEFGCWVWGGGRNRLGASDASLRCERSELTFASEASIRYERSEFHIHVVIGAWQHVTITSQPIQCLAYLAI